MYWRTSLIASVRRRATIFPVSVIIICSSLNSLSSKWPTADFLYPSSVSSRYSGILRIPENAAQRKIPNAPIASNLSDSMTQCSSTHVWRHSDHPPFFRRTISFVWETFEIILTINAAWAAETRLDSHELTSISVPALTDIYLASKRSWKSAASSVTRRSAEFCPLLLELWMSARRRACVRSVLRCYTLSSDSIDMMPVVATVVDYILSLTRSSASSSSFFWSIAPKNSRTDEQKIADKREPEETCRWQKGSLNGL